MKTKIKRIRKRKTKRKMYGGINYYTTFLEQHFLTPTLDHIFHKTSLRGQFFGTGPECHITILGDSHNVITNQGTDMITAFRRFTSDYTTYRALLPHLDVFIESTENSAINLYPTMQIDPAKQQIINVGIDLQRCHSAGACSFNLHWIDTLDAPVYKLSYLNPPCVGTPTTAQTKLPRWIYDLGTMHLSSVNILQALWRHNFSISSKIRTTDIANGIRFTDIHDCMKILTENCIIKREIAKATRVNPQFTYGYAKALLRELILRPTYARDITLPAMVCRQVLEIYTVARIINKRMTHVIIYVGAAHSTFLSQVVRTMGLRTVDHVDEAGTNAMPIDATIDPYDSIPTYNNIPYIANLPQLIPEPEDDDTMYLAQPMDALFILPPQPQPPPPPPMQISPPTPPPPPMHISPPTPPPPTMYIPPPLPPTIPPPMQIFPPTPPPPTMYIPPPLPPPMQIFPPPPPPPPPMYIPTPPMYVPPHTELRRARDNLEWLSRI